MLRLKACPRCGGDMHDNRDEYGIYAECLQCGYMRDLEDAKRLSRLLEFASAERDGGDGKKSAA